jgi:iron complex outermembrane receptor protein
MKSKFRVCSLVMAVLTSPLALGQGSEEAGLEEVLVTAQKRSESLQEVPIAITAMSSKDMENREAFNFADVAASVPTVTLAPYPSSSNALILFIRGQGANDVGQITKEGAVGMYIDGVYLSRPQSVSMDLADVEQVEILRGPQGTLYGRNTTGGAVNIMTKKPTGELDLKQSFTVGNRDRYRSLSELNLPAFANVSTKISYLDSSVDGYVNNAGPGNDYGQDAQQAGRAALRWEPLDTILVDYAFESGKVKSTPIYYQNDLLASEAYPTSPHSRSSRPADLPNSHTDNTRHSLIGTWEVSDELTLKSISGYSDLDTKYYQDYLDAAFIASYYKSADKIHSHEWSQELQAIGSGLDQRLEYVAGLYYFEQSGNHQQNLQLLDLADNFDPDGAVPDPLALEYDRYTRANTESAAAYTQLKYTPDILEDRLSLTAGARYTKDKPHGVRTLDATIVDYQVVVPIESGTRAKSSYDSFDPMFITAYQWTDELNTYAKVVTGYKAGGFGEAAADFSLPYDPEDVTNYEVGMKSYWWDRKLLLNLAAFTTDYSDMQMDLSPDPAQIQVVNTYNAGSATVDGFETDLTLQLSQNLRFVAQYAYLDYQIDSVENPVTGADVTSEFSLPYAPKNAYNLALNYTYPNFSFGTVDAFVEYSWQDESFTTAGTTSIPSVKQDWTRGDYGLLNARIALTLDSLGIGDVQLAFWGKNLQDENYEAHRFTAGAGAAIAWAAPRTYGLDIIYEF